MMRPEGNVLDLNNLPDDYTRDGKQVIEDCSSAEVYTKEKSGAKEGEDMSGTEYECRFCSLKFSKSQALGGHMNRHRQERETETLNKARQLVFCNDNVLASQMISQLGSWPPITPAIYHREANMGSDLSVSRVKSLPIRMYYGSSSSTLLSQQSQPQPRQLPHQPYLNAPPSRPSTIPMHYPPEHLPNDSFVGPMNYASGAVLESINSTCFDAPLDGHGIGSESTRASELVGLVGSTQQLLDAPFPIDEFAFTSDSF